MATTATITQIFIHRPLFRATNTPLSLLHSPKLSFPLLKSQTRSLFTSSLPLYCSLEDNTNNLDDVEEDEVGPVFKFPEIKEKKEVPELSVKERKDLCSYANSLGDKLKSQQVGKSGVTENVVFALSETLEKNELLKLKIHRTCPGELVDVVKHLELATGSVVVGQIGRTVIFYRPSLTKLEAEKKKERARKLFAQKREKAEAAFMKRERSPRQQGRGKFGSRRSEKIAT